MASCNGAGSTCSESAACCNPWRRWASSCAQGRAVTQLGDPAAKIHQRLDNSRGIAQGVEHPGGLAQPPVFVPEAMLPQCGTQQAHPARARLMRVRA